MHRVAWLFVMLGCGGRVAIHVHAGADASMHEPWSDVPDADVVGPDADSILPSVVDALPPFDCGVTGRCLSTTRGYSGGLGGLAGANAICAAEYPGSHFYRQSCDGEREREGAFGFAELEAGSCWDCDFWTSSSSGSYQPNGAACPTGYATAGALLPASLCADAALTQGLCWRICEATEKPLICCIP